MQFLPSSWAQYGVDATGSGYEDPYNPADAIFAAARYLAAAGGAQHIRAAVYSYNHSAAYVEAVMLRAQLLGGTPPELLSAITGLTESRFPVHAEAHFSDGFPALAPGRARQDARGDRDLRAGRGARDRRAGRRSDRRRRIADAGALRLAARRLRQHLHLRAAGQRRRGLPGARTARGHRRQRADRPSRQRRRAAPVPSPARPRAPACSRTHPSRRRRSPPAWRWGRRTPWKRPPRRSRPRHLRCSQRPRRAGRPRRRTPSAPAPTRSISTRCAPVCRCWPAPCSGTSARRAKRKTLPLPRDGLRRRGRRHPPRRGAGRRRARDGGAHALPDPPRGRGGAADRPQADPRRLGAPGRDVGVQGQGREPLPGDLAHRRAGAAGVQAAARAAAAARPRRPSAGVRARRGARRRGRPARAGGARVPLGIRLEPHGLRGRLRTRHRRARRGQHDRAPPRATRSTSPRSTAPRSPGTKGRARSPTSRCAGCCGCRAR